MSLVYTPYSVSDLCASQALLQLHTSKLKKAVDTRDWSGIQRALVGIQIESEFAQKVTTALQAHHRDQPYSRASV